MSAIKFEALRIHFLSQVFLALAVVVASTPKFLCPSAYRAVHLTMAHGGNQPTRVSTHRRAFAGGYLGLEWCLYILQCIHIKGLSARP